jgi:asparagine synthase (glutamine-hydrolysing)
VTIMPDITGMACSLEARNPFLDHELVEFLLGVDADVLNHQKQNKYLLAKAMAGQIPQSIIDRPKEGFSGMTGEQMTRWMRGPGRKLFHDALLDSKFVNQGYLQRAALETLWERYEAIPNPKQAVVYQLPIWTAGLLAQWYDRHVAR